MTLWSTPAIPTGCSYRKIYKYMYRTCVAQYYVPYIKKTFYSLFSQKNLGKYFPFNINNLVDKNLKQNVYL